MIDYEQLTEAIWAKLQLRPDVHKTHEDMMSCLRQWGTPASHIANQRYRGLVVDMLRSAPPSESPYFWERYKASLLYDARTSFDAYLLYVEIDRRNDTKFYQPRRHYLAPMVSAYQQILDGELDLLTISMPKRAGKSQTGINFVNMISGLHPHKSSLMEGAGDTLITSFYKGCLEYLSDPVNYNFYEIFPECKLVETNADVHTINLNAKDRFATITCRSIDSTQVGSTEATNVLYLDDCVESRAVATNRALLDKKWEGITGDVMGRRLEGTPMVFTGTRYSLYDPIGRIQDFARDKGMRWKAIEIPALDLVTDESNYEYTDRDGNKQFSTAYFREQRDLLTAEQFESEFQQQPFEAKGTLFPRDRLNYFRELPQDVDPDTIIACCDTAERGEDSASMPVAAIYGDDVYIIDVMHDNSAPEVTKPLCARILARNKVANATFESNAAGEYYARDVDKLLKDMHAHCGIRTKRTVSNKQTRIEMASDNILRHFWFRGWDTLPKNGQYYAFMLEVVRYTRSGKVPHDDAPDSLSLLENEIRNLSAGRAEVFRRPF